MRTQKTKLIDFILSKRPFTGFSDFHKLFLFLKQRFQNQNLKK